MQNNAIAAQFGDAPARPRQGAHRMLFAFVVLLLTLDFAQWHDVLDGRDVRAWQFILGAIFITMVMSRRKFIVPRATMILVVLFGHTLVASVVGGDFNGFSYVQIALIAFGLLTTFNLIERIGCDGLIRAYILAAVIVAGSMYLEEILYLVYPGIAYSAWYEHVRLYNELGFMVRAHGILMEPSQASLILPAAAFCAWWQRRQALGLFLAGAILLTLSALTYAATAIALVGYLYVNSTRRIFGLLPLLLLGPVLSLAPPIQNRLDAIMEVANVASDLGRLDSKDVHELLGGTVGALTVNADVAYESFVQTAGVGVGLGNFGDAFDRYLPFSGVNAENARESSYLFHNTDTGGSLIIRMVAELGLLGLFFVGYSCVWLFSGLKTCKSRWQNLRGNPEDLARMGLYVQCFVMCAATIFTYFIRKDGYFNIYLLLPLAGAVIALRGIRSGGGAATGLEPEQRGAVRSMR